MHQVVIVRRGETARLSLLRETFIAATAVIWDRRFVDRRQHPERRVPNRRRHDRRGQPARSWTDLGFLIFEIPVGSQFRVGGSGSVHSLHPIEGDVLMVREVHAGGPYAVSRVPEPAGALFASYGIALQHSFELVQASGVNLWYTEDHKTFSMLHRSRSAS